MLQNMSLLALMILSLGEAVVILKMNSHLRRVRKSRGSDARHWSGETK